MPLSNRQRKMSRQEQISRKQGAKDLLKHPLVVEFFEAGEESLFQRFSSPYSPDGEIASEKDRERLFYMLQALQEFKQFFQKIIIDGNMAEKELAD